MKEKEYMYRINNNLDIIDSIIESVFEQNFRKKYFSKNPYDFMQREENINNHNEENGYEYSDNDDLFNENGENENSTNRSSRYLNSNHTNK